MSEAALVQTTVNCPSCKRIQFEKPDRRYCIACRSTLYPHIVSRTVIHAIETHRKELFPPISPEPGQLTKIVMHKLCEARKRRRWSQKEMGRRSKMFRTNITRLEKSHKQTTVATLQRLAAVLELDFTELLMQSEAELGRPMKWDRTFMEDIVIAAPKLSDEQRTIILDAAEKLSRGQYTFPDWIRI